MLSNVYEHLSGTRSTLPSWTHEVGNGSMNLIIQFHDPSDMRGAVNAMIRLIEAHGLEKLQRVGIASQGSSTVHLRWQQRRSPSLTSRQVRIRRRLLPLQACTTSRYIRTPLHETF